LVLIVGLIDGLNTAYDLCPKSCIMITNINTTRISANKAYDAYFLKVFMLV